MSGGSERLRLTKAIDAWFGDFPLEMIEIGTLSARASVSDPLPDGARALLRFFWREQEHEILAEVATASGGFAILHLLDDGNGLADAVDRTTRELIAAQLANATGSREANIFDGDQTLTAASAGAAASLKKYVTLRLTDHGWDRTVSLVPDQPGDGFTVSAAESEEQIALLRDTYEHGDDATREMTRTLASMSVT